MDHIAAVLIDHQWLVDPQNLLALLLQNNYDFRKTINTLQFLSVRPFQDSREEIRRYGYQRYSTLLYWPLQPVEVPVEVSAPENTKENQWKVSMNESDLYCDDRTFDFVNGNFLRFFSDLHPSPSTPLPSSIPTISIHRLSSAKFPLRGGILTIRGSNLHTVGEVLLQGCGEGALPLEFLSQHKKALTVRIPSLPYGLYHLMCVLRDGRLAEESVLSRWFGNVAILVMAVE